MKRVLEILSAHLQITATSHTVGWTIPAKFGKISKKEIDELTQEERNLFGFFTTAGVIIGSKEHIVIPVWAISLLEDGTKIVNMESDAVLTIGTDHVSTVSSAGNTPARYCFF